MRRREFIAGLGAAAVLPLAARAQQPAVPVVGYLDNYPPAPGGIGRGQAAVLKGLADTGFVDGRNVAIEYRWVEGQNERLPAILRDLIERRVAVLAVVQPTKLELAINLKTAKALGLTIPETLLATADEVIQ